MSQEISHNIIYQQNKNGAVYLNIFYKLTVFSNEDIFRFQVPINDSFRMKMRESKRYLGRKKLGLIFREHSYFNQMTK